MAVTISLATTVHHHKAHSIRYLVVFLLATRVKRYLGLYQSRYGARTCGISRQLSPKNIWLDHPMQNAYIAFRSEEFTWAKLASTRRGKVARMRRATRHSTTKPTMKEVRSEVMFCRITDILSAIADFTSAASLAKRAATRLELFSSSSNQPTSFRKIAAEAFFWDSLIGICSLKERRNSTGRVLSYRQASSFSPWL